MFKQIELSVYLSMFGQISRLYKIFSYYYDNSNNKITENSDWPCRSQAFPCKLQRYYEQEYIYFLFAWVWSVQALDRKCSNVFFGSLETKWSYVEIITTRMLATHFVGHPITCPIDWTILFFYLILFIFFG